MPSISFLHHICIYLAFVFQAFMYFILFFFAHFFFFLLLFLLLLFSKFSCHDFVVTVDIWNISFSFLCFGLAFSVKSFYSLIVSSVSTKCLLFYLLLLVVVGTLIEFYALLFVSYTFILVIRGVYVLMS